MDERVNGLPDQAQAATLKVWEWRSRGIYLIGSTVAQTVRIRYQVQLAALVDGTSDVLIGGAVDALAYRASAMAARSRGNVTLTADLLKGYEEQIDKILAAESKIEGYRQRKRWWQKDTPVAA